MVLTTRLKRLESVCYGRLCGVCGGRGPIVISHWNQGDPEPQAKGCPSCGEVFHIIVRHIQMPPLMEREP